MLKNYFKIAVRNLFGSKVYSFINIIGLTIGIVCTILLSLYVIDELNYDDFYKNPDRVFRVYTQMNFNGIESTKGQVSAPLASAIKEKFPEVETVCRLGYFGNQYLTYNDNTFREWSIYGVDDNYFEMVPLKFIEGDSKTALSQTNSIVISQNAAIKYFGEENPLGKMIESEKWGNYLVTGVFENYPDNSHFKSDFLVSMETFPSSKERNWIALTYYTYVVLKEGVKKEVFETKLQDLVYGELGSQIYQMLGITIEDLLAKGNEYSFKIQPLTDIYLYSARLYGIDINSEWGDVTIGDIAYVYIFGLVAFFILLLAIINYMNLSTARAERRAKEVGIRKTLGTNKSNLIVQFLSESIITVSISVLFSLVVLEVVLPIFNGIAGKNLSINYLNSFYAIPGLFLLTLFIGVIAGSYPAFYLSSINPVQILKSGRTRRKGKLHSILVVLQFAVSIALIVSTVIIKDQLEFIQNKSLGFNKEHLVAISNSQELSDKVKSFKETILNNANVSAVTLSTKMFDPGIPANGYLFNGSDDNIPILCQSLNVDYDFLNTFQINMKDGRFFSRDFTTDYEAIIINQATADEFKDENLIGKELVKLGIGNQNAKYRVIGIIDNFNYESLHQEVRPLAIHLGNPTQSNSRITLRISSNDVNNTIETIKEEWAGFINNEPVSLRFVDETLQRLYESEKEAGIIVAIFTSLALVIACLGLFGLVTFVTEQKVKEIGIRKSLGASSLEIVLLLSKKFSKLVLIANLIAWPAAYYFMTKWLQDFAYRVEIDAFTFLFAGMAVLFVAITTVSLKAVKASLANPVDSLRNE